VSSELSPEQSAVQQTARAFFDEHATPSRISELDATETYPAEILDEMAKLGFWGMAIDPEHGGSDIDQVSRCVVLEEMARAGSSLTYAFIPTALFCAEAIARFGDDRQRAEMLPRIAAGELRMAMSLTEPDSGSDMMGITTRGDVEHDEIVIRGQKIFTTGADAAEQIVVLVRTDRDARARGALSLVLVPTSSPGVEIRSLRKLAAQATHTCEVYFDDVRVPLANVIGSLNMGASIVLELMDADRVYAAAQSLGTATGAFDLALQYAKERHQFGKAIIEHQAVAHMLADMAIRTDSARMLVHAAAQRLADGLPCRREAAIAKVAASETSSFCAAHGMQILGGYSYMLEYGMERFYRESKIHEIMGGTNQILRTVIAREL
jgi:alkylation response protein AidB-like acyl-CoA dehydrogenase